MNLAEVILVLDDERILALPEDRNAEQHRDATKPCTG